MDHSDIMVFFCTELDEETGAKEQYVSHGVNIKTHENVVLPSDPRWKFIDQCVFDRDYWEWFLK